MTPPLVYAAGMDNTRKGAGLLVVAALAWLLHAIGLGEISLLSVVLLLTVVICAIAGLALIAWGLLARSD